ncbi:serine/threonine-protein kinase SRPK [Colletotrichum spaethianum]|uniref:Serine/threonine-protein kinase SRPK n=1 Tax=Colletotrichum spaethianum TaxID=700344 RepID=A0AA37P503_9PEZI|nr:serine/threonine-protein kinase SRPK [Colletotrichum spaethianum]GKT42531.1 serine/threonine-protein kinase SRPK [Colletotrichum spaethianum]
MASPLPTPPPQDPTAEKHFRFHETGTPCEWAESYHPGGFHPVHFGDVFADRYEVIRKLGNGSFGTAWLAVDSLLRLPNGKNPKELPIHRFLATKAIGDSFSKYVVNAVDSFHHDGPNGRHLCLVLEPMGPSVSSILNAPHEIYDPLNPPVQRFAKEKSKRILRNVLSALHFLHGNGLVHGDLQSGNILFALQDLSAIGLEQLKQDESTSRIDCLRRIDGKVDTWAPNYLVVSQSLSEYIVPDPDDVIKLSDLGGAFFVDDPPTRVVTPMSLRAPELILDETFGIGVDIWSFGCLLFEFITGTPLSQLPQFGLSDEALMDEHLIQLTDIIQPLPENLMSKWPFSSKYYGSEGERLDARPRDFDEDDSVEEFDDQEDAEDMHDFDEDTVFDFDVQERKPPRRFDSLEKLISDNKPSDVDKTEGEIIISLLRSIFHYDPEKRPTAAELLEHAWFKN